MSPVGSAEKPDLERTQWPPEECKNQSTTNRSQTSFSEGARARVCACVRVCMHFCAQKGSAVSQLRPCHAQMETVAPQGLGDVTFISG